MMLEELREQVWKGNLALPANGLVAWTGGNLSAITADRELIVIKPSGMLYTDMTPADMVVVDSTGRVVDGDRGPSSDTASHLAIYAGREDVGSVVHTHSRHATAFAAVGKPIPCCLTAIADEFGGEIPVGPFAIIGDDSIGKGIVETLRSSRSRAVLMANHGPFTIGHDARDAVKAAVMVEDVARTVHLARQLGEPKPIAQSDIDKLFERYQNVYGQH